MSPPAPRLPLLGGGRHPGLRTEVRAWLGAHLPPGRDPADFDPFDYHRAGIDRAAWMQALGEAGYAAPTWPPEYGGGGYSRDEALVILEEFALAGAPPHEDVIGLGMAGPMLLELGSAEQKRRWLRAITRGEGIWCQLFSEPGSGSDLASMTTTARRDGDGYVVTGQKVWTSNADVARWGLLVTRLAGAGERAYVALAVDMAHPAVAVRPVRQAHGRATFCEVFLDDVPVPPADRIGEEADGWRVAITTLLYERATLSGFGFAIRGPLDRLAAAVPAMPAPTRATALEVLAGGLVHDLAVRRFALADGGTGPPGGTPWFLLKLSFAHLNMRATDLLWRALGAGAGGDLARAETEAMVRARANTIEGGTSEICRSTIGERLLGLPKEPR